MILFFFFLINFLLIFKCKLFFLPCLLREHPIGTWCMYSTYHIDQSLDIIIIDSNNQKLNITKDALKYLPGNFSNGNLTTLAHNNIFPSAYAKILLENILSCTERIFLSNAKCAYLIYSYKDRNNLYFHTNFIKL